MMGNLKNLAELTSAVSNVRQVLRLPIDKVISQPQVRVQFKNLDELAASMQEEGQQSPIIVSPKNSLGQYVIQKGERRWRAAKIAGLETVDSIINKKDQTATELMAGQLIENIQRDDLTPLEIGLAITELISAGWTQKKIAQYLGKSASYVSIYATLANMDDTLKSLHNEDLVTDASSLAALHKMHELNKEKTLAFIEEIKEKGNATRSEIRQRMTQLQTPKHSLSSTKSDEKLKKQEKSTSRDLADIYTIASVDRLVSIKLFVLYVIATTDKTTLQDLHLQTGIPHSSLSRIITQLRHEDGIGIAYVRTQSSGKQRLPVGKSGHYEIESWGKFNGEKFLVTFKEMADSLVKS